MASDHAHTAADPLDRVDRLAAILIARAPAIRLDIAQTTADREAVFRLRYEAVIERDWAPPDAMPGGLERDADDERAVLVGGWDDERLVAAGRVLFPSPERRLPVERVFELTVEPSGKVAHVDRLCVARTHRDSNHRVFGALIGRCWQEVRANGFVACCGIDSAGMVRVFKRVGLPLTPLGPPRPYWGQLRSPMLFDPGNARLIEPTPTGREPRERGAQPAI